MKQYSMLPYLYRDAANYKVHGTIWLAGHLTSQSFAALQLKLVDGERFIPFDLHLGLRELQHDVSSVPSEDDHVFHEIDFFAMQHLDEVPTGQAIIELVDFLNAFDRISAPDAWDISAAETRLGIGFGMAFEM